ncbi:MAG: tetratricopeptide repeat protein, partial [Candidatus Sumerlaeota bacterium]
DQWRHHVLMGLILEQYRKYSMAISAYRRALEIQPEQFYTWFRLGICYRHLGMQRPALEAQQQAKALRPWHSGVESELGKSSKGINLKGLFRRWFNKE